MGENRNRELDSIASYLIINDILQEIRVSCLFLQLKRIVTFYKQMFCIWQIYVCMKSETKYISGSKWCYTVYITD